MRLQQFINETVRIGTTNYSERDFNRFFEAWQKIEKDCAPFLKELRARNRNRKLMLRGSDSSKYVELRTTRKDRYPKDTPGDWHNAFDDAFEQLYGWPARSQGLFCTGRHSTANDYGSEVFAIFPVGRYRYLWSDEIIDLYNMVDNGDINQYIEPDSSDRAEWEQEYEDEFGEGGNGYWRMGWTDYTSDRDESADQVAEGDIERLEDALDELESDYENETIDEDEYSERKSELNDELDSYKSGGSAWQEIYDKLEWNPYQDLEDFMTDKEENYWEYIEPSQYEDAAFQALRGKYNNKALVKGLHHPKGTEIMVDCNKYWMIDYSKYEDLLLHMVFVNNEDPRQLSFDFFKK